MDALEFVKAIAPYVTAVVAMLVAAFTAWLGHRNWIKQFKIQRSEAMLKEQIRLLQEVPKTLNDAMRLAMQTVYTLACSDAFARAQSSAAANEFMKDYSEYQARFHDLLSELEVPEISVRLYFGEEAADKIATYRNLLLHSSASSAHIGGASSAIEQLLRNADLNSIDMHALMAKATPTVMPYIAQAFTAAKEERLAVIRTMAARVVPNDA
ncbi:MAG: hypothetical protein HY067_20980 [Betaproteobacteria bacterium]|nr:hypothetical protein [Betaproteobacteria bacterium]